MVSCSNGSLNGAEILGIASFGSRPNQNVSRFPLSRWISYSNFQQPDSYLITILSAEFSVTSANMSTSKLETILSGLVSDLVYGEAFGTSKLCLAWLDNRDVETELLESLGGIMDR